jgi:chromosomal replication initiation ATPase DnaA
VTVLGVCNAFIVDGRCPGRIVEIEQVGALVHGECEQCGTLAAVPVYSTDPTARRKLRLERSGVPARFLGVPFKQDEHNRDALEKVRGWFAETELLPAPALWGLGGRGKSHLLAAICVRLINERDVAAMVTSTRSLLRDLQRFENETERGRSWAQATTIDVLLLDDLGAQQVTDWRHDQIADLIEERYAGERPIVVATNYPPSQWERVMDERSASRLRGMTFGVELRGPDRRGQDNRAQEDPQQ